MADGSARLPRVQDLGMRATLPRGGDPAARGRLWWRRRWRARALLRPLRTRKPTRPPWRRSKAMWVPWAPVMLTREGLADPGGTGVATLAELMPQPVGPDPRLVTDGAVDVSMASGPLEGARNSWMRRWQNADGGATVAAYGYASPTEARRHAEAWLTEQAKSTIETFEIPDVAV